MLGTVRSRVLALVLTAGSGSWILACGGGDGGPSSPGGDEVTSVTVQPEQAELTSLGQTVQLSATAKAADGGQISGVSFTWSSSDTDVASVSATGLVMAQGNGTATVTATGEGVAGTAEITVSQAVGSVRVTPASASTSPGGHVQFSAQALDGNGNSVAGAALAWHSSDESVATVDQSGLATGQADGTTTISATAEGVTGNATLSVTRQVATVEVTPGDAQVDAIDATAQFTAEAKDGNGEHIDGVAFTWTSSDESVATVNTGGLATAAGNGTTTITATADGISGAATLVVDQVATSVQVTPGSASTAVDGTVQFAAEAQDANGHAVEGESFQWSSGDEAVATVNQSGLATGEAPGSTQITATSGTLSGSATLTVTESAGSIRLVSGNNQNGKTQQDFTEPLVVEVLDGGGNPAAGVTVTWSVDQGDATVSETSVQTDAQGRAQVTLTGGKQLTAHVVHAAAEGLDGSPVEFDARTTVLVALIGDPYYFEDLEGRRNGNFQVTVSVGDTIEFSYPTGASVHTATSDTEPAGGQPFDSGNMNPGDTFRFVPGVVGTWIFHCAFHSGLGMANARIVVN